MSTKTFVYQLLILKDIEWGKRVPLRVLKWYPSSDSYLLQRQYPFEERVKRVLKWCHEKG